MSAPHSSGPDAGPRRPLAAIALLAAAALVGATMSALFFSPRAGPALPLVRILEPEVGPPTAPTPLPVPAERSVAVRGVVLHAHPIRELRLNGRRLPADFARDRMTAEFTGYLDASDLRGGRRGGAIAGRGGPSSGPSTGPSDSHFEIEVRAINGSRAVRPFPARRLEPGDEPGAPSFEEVAGGERRQRWAVVIGAGTFADPGIEPRPAVEARARELAAFLSSPAAGLGGLPASHVRLLTGPEATSRNIRSALATFLRGATPTDLVLVFLAGRSAPDPDPRGPPYLLTYDTDPGELPATAVPLDHLTRALDDVYAANRVVLVDAGPALAASLPDAVRPRQGGLALLAAHPDPFGDEVLAALHGAADTDGDRIVRLQELIDHLPGTLARTTYDRHWPLASVEARIVGR